MLVVNGLVKRFGGFTAVNNVSFEVKQGEILGLIGPNGSGKSTIFNMLSGTFPPSAGSILFDGSEIAGLPPHKIINRGIGRTFQIPRPFRRLSIFENVVLAGYYGQGSHSLARANDSAELSNPAWLAGSSGKLRVGRKSTPVSSAMEWSYSALFRRRAGNGPGSPA